VFVSDNIDLGPCWDSVVELALKRQWFKERMGVPERWDEKTSGQAKINGLLAEKAYSIYSGLPMSIELLLGADDGNDFSDGTDVKTATHSDPDLKHPVGSLKWPRVRFVLVKLDVNRRTATLLGFAWTHIVKRAPVKVYRQDAGPQHFINWRGLHRMDFRECKRCQPDLYIR
jgi:hypothetical protein